MLGTDKDPAEDGGDAISTGGQHRQQNNRTPKEFRD